MIEPQTGNYRMLSSGLEVRDALNDGNLVMVGTEDEVAAVAQRVRLGLAEQERRVARRRQQRASRKRNR